MPGYLVPVEKAGKARAVGSALKSNPFHIGTGAVLAGAGAAQLPQLERKRGPEQRRAADVASATAAGAVGGQAAWLGTGYRIRALGHRVERERPEGMSRSAHQKIMSNHHRATGVPNGTKPDRAHAPKFYRQYPEGLPATKYKRRLGQMSGGRGAAIQSAVLGAGALAGATAAQRRKSVSKLYVRDTQTSPVRLLETAAGAGLAAWGLGRSPMVGRALGRGLKMARNSNNAYAVEALQRAQSAQGVLGRATAPGERALRSVRAVDQAINRVPRALRPDIALAAGTLLVGHAAPIRQRSYHPVRINIRTRGY